MASFTITSTINSLEATGGDKKTASFTIVNISDKAKKARIKIISLDTPGDWLSGDYDEIQELNSGETSSVTVNIVAKPVDKDSQFSFRVDVITVEDPDEDFTESAPIQLSIKKTEESKPEEPEEEEKPFAWWWLLVGLGGAAVVAVVVVLIIWPPWQSKEEMPNVMGLQYAAAIDKLVNAGANINLINLVQKKGVVEKVGLVTGQDPLESALLDQISKTDILLTYTIFQSGTPPRTTTPAKDLGIISEAIIMSIDSAVISTHEKNRLRDIQVENTKMIHKLNN